MIIIGSTAIKFWFPDFNREPKDKDWAVINKKDHTSSQYEEFLENPVILKHVNEGELYLKPDLLLTLKMSHIFWNNNYDKHLFDIQFLLSKGCKYDIDLFYELYNYWLTVLPPVKRSNLDMSKDEFFTNAINYDEQEHDFLHTLINPTPSYTTILKDGKEVEISEEKFLSLTFEQKCDIVREENYVMAYERYRQIHYIPAYYRMFNKFIRQHAPLWMVPFIIENFHTLRKPTINFINIIQNGLENSRLKKN